MDRKGFSKSCKRFTDISCCCNCRVKSSIRAFNAFVCASADALIWSSMASKARSIGVNLVVIGFSFGDVMKVMPARNGQGPVSGHGAEMFCNWTDLWRPSVKPEPAAIERGTTFPLGRKPLPGGGQRALASFMGQLAGQGGFVRCADPEGLFECRAPQTHPRLRGCIPRTDGDRLGSHMMDDKPAFRATVMQPVQNVPAILDRACRNQGQDVIGNDMADIVCGRCQACPVVFGLQFQHPVRKRQQPAPSGSLGIGPAKTMVHGIAKRIPCRILPLGRCRVEATLPSIRPHDPARDRHVDFQRTGMRMCGGIDRRTRQRRNAGHRCIEPEPEHHIGAEPRPRVAAVERFGIDIIPRKRHRAGGVAMPACA